MNERIESKAMTTAMNERFKLNTDEMAARQTAHLITNLLNKFIPDFCLQETFNTIFEACMKEGIELTSKSMRKEYEAWKSTQIEMPNILIKKE